MSCNTSIKEWQSAGYLAKALGIKHQTAIIKMNVPGYIIEKRDSTEADRQLECMRPKPGGAPKTLYRATPASLIPYTGTIHEWQSVAQLADVLGSTVDIIRNTMEAGEHRIEKRKVNDEDSQSRECMRLSERPPRTLYRVPPPNGGEHVPAPEVKLSSWVPASKRLKIEPEEAPRFESERFAILKDYAREKSTENERLTDENANLRRMIEALHKGQDELRQSMATGVEAGHKMQAEILKLRNADLKSAEKISTLSFENLQLKNAAERLSTSKLMAHNKELQKSVAEMCRESDKFGEELQAEVNKLQAQIDELTQHNTALAAERTRYRKERNEAFRQLSEAKPSKLRFKLGPLSVSTEIGGGL